MFAGHEIEGGTSSVTVTSNEQVAVFPEPSVAVKVTVDVPAGNALPEVGPAVWVTTGFGQLSVAMGVAKFTTASHAPGAADTEMSTGQVIDVDAGFHLRIL